MPKSNRVAKRPKAFVDSNSLRSASESESAYNEREPAKSDSSLLEILGILRTQTQIDLSEYKLTTISRRVQRQMKIHKADSLLAYANFLNSNPEAIKELRDEIFIHVTEFFRDPDAFDTLRRQVLPKLLSTRIQGAPLRLWVPGCSTGEEAYSLAILLSDYIDTLNEKVPFQIFATDISEHAVEKARSGIYAEDEVSGLSEAQLATYFEKAPGGYKILRSLRDNCVFSRHDLTRNPPFAKIDLISCRNVLIYFAPELQKHVMPVFHYSLNKNGFLWLGRSESPGSISKLFTLIDKTNKIFSKVDGTAPVKFRFPSTRITEIIDGSKKNPVQTLSANEQQKEIDRIAMSRYAPAGAVFNADMEILQVRGHTAPFLELPSGQPTHNILKMIRPELLPALRFIFQRALKANAPSRKEGLSCETGHGRKKINLEVIPVNPEFPVKDRQYLVFFEEVEGKKKKAEPKAVPLKKKNLSQKSSHDSYVAELLQELDSLREYQQSVSEGYEATQEELTSSNEELQSTLEEFQSTNEELETAKEELQAANEELSTLNDELQGRNDDLISLNEKLQESEARFRLMVEGVKDYAIFMLDPNGKVTSWNEGARRLKGYSDAEIIGKHFSAFYTEEDKKRDKPGWELEQAVKDGRVQDEGWRVRKDGTTFWANVIITRIQSEKGKLIGFSKITRDLTEPKAAEEKLRLSELRARLMTESVKDYAIFMLDPEGKVATWNEGAKRLKYYEANEIIGQHFSKFYPEEDLRNEKPQREIEIALANGRVEDEGWRIRKDGTKFWANVVITKVSDENGNLLGFTKVTRDLTERKRTEEQLKAAKETLEIRVRERTAELQSALKVREEFLSIASHELKTPLTSLRLQIQMALRKLDKLDAKQMSDALELCLKQTNALVSLVDDLLDVSRAQTGRFSLNCEDLDLSDLTRDVLKRLSSQLSTAGISVELDLQEPLVGHWDRQRLEQVITNLFSNAVKYAPRKPLLISTEIGNNKARLIVKDHGPGIDQGNQNKIFERFERASQSKNSGGLGLGLYIVREILDAHGGTISVESDPGHGAKFCVELPMQSCLDESEESK